MDNLNRSLHQGWIHFFSLPLSLAIQTEELHGGLHFIPNLEPENKVNKQYLCMGVSEFILGIMRERNTEMREGEMVRDKRTDFDVLTSNSSPCESGNLYHHSSFASFITLVVVSFSLSLSLLLYSVSFSREPLLVMASSRAGIWTWEWKPYGVREKG